MAQLLCEKERSRFFEKKRRKKLPGIWASAAGMQTPQAEIHKSLFGSSGG
jgi:hypothetical protein